MQLTLPACVLPGCTTPVAAWGDACTGCRNAFGHMLAPRGAALTEDQIRDRDAQVAAAYRRRR